MIMNIACEMFSSSVIKKTTGMVRVLTKYLNEVSKNLMKMNFKIVGKSQHNLV